MRSSPSVSPLHTKGFLTLGLVILAESVTITNAVKLWTSYHNHASGRGDYFDGDTPFSKASRDAQECLSASSEDCPAVLHSLSPVAKRTTLGRLTRRAILPGKQKDHCDDCSHCTAADPSSVASSPADQKCNTIPRGGDQQILETTAATAQAIMPYGIPLNGWKIIFQALLTTLNVLCWLIPLRSKKISENKLALSLANAFSGGVFLSLAFGHLIPECVHGFEGYNEVTPYLLVMGGYLLIFFIEKVAFDPHEILHEMEHAQENDKTDKQNGNSHGGATSGRSALILLGALAVHSILEMAALGLADTFGDSAILTLSIALHQVSIVSFLLSEAMICTHISILLSST
jgi:zinc transporter 1/2/3